MAKNDRSDEKMTSGIVALSPSSMSSSADVLPGNHLPSINWETKLGKQFPSYYKKNSSTFPDRGPPRPNLAAIILGALRKARWLRAQLPAHHFRADFMAYHRPAL